MAPIETQQTLKKVQRFKEIARRKQLDPTFEAE
jgi:hypothetical protein